jgi:hypothetical protein
MCEEENKLGEIYFFFCFAHLLRLQGDKQNQNVSNIGGYDCKNLTLSGYMLFYVFQD